MGVFTKLFRQSGDSRRIVPIRKNELPASLGGISGTNSQATRQANNGLLRNLFSEKELMDCIARASFTQPHNPPGPPDSVELLASYLRHTFLQRGAKGFHSFCRVFCAFPQRFPAVN
jgi:hypothetical protein